MVAQRGCPFRGYGLAALAQNTMENAPPFADIDLRVVPGGST